MVFDVLDVYKYFQEFTNFIRVLILNDLIFYDPLVFDVLHVYKYFQEFTNFIKIVIPNDLILHAKHQKPMGHIVRLSN